MLKYAKGQVGYLCCTKTVRIKLILSAGNRTAGGNSPRQSQWLGSLLSMYPCFLHIIYVHCSQEPYL